MSTSMPSRFISRTTSRPNAVSPPCRGGVGGGVGPVVVAAVRERHVADAQLVVGPQRAEAVLDRQAVLHAQERGDAALAPRGLHVGRARREREHVGIGRDHAARHVDLLELGAGEPARSLGRDQDAPELSRDADPRAGAGCPCRPVAPRAQVQQRQRASQVSRSSQGRSLWPSTSPTLSRQRARASPARHPAAKSGAVRQETAG